MSVFATRRAQLMKKLKRPVLLFAGGLISRNYPANWFAFRADSNFLYFFAEPEAGSAAWLDPADGKVRLFLPERTVEDALWHGATESFAEARARHGVDEVLAVEQLEEQVLKLAHGRTVDTLAVADAKATRRARAITGADADFDDPSRVGSAELVDAIVSLRLKKGPEELAQMKATSEVTRQAHVDAIKHSRPGATEELIAGLVEGAFARHGCAPAYGTICSVRGEVLHNHRQQYTLEAGDIMLLDAGAEAKSGYCSDVTRAWPVGGPFTPEGRAVYELVLAANLAAIAAVKPGVRYRDIHLLSARVIADGLVELGLLKGTGSARVESGAHALFYPHGVGHQLGLDVHDFETFGDRVLYPGRQRSPQFGTGFLRMDMDLAEGMTFTIEPGVYFVPAILRSQKFRDQFKGEVDFEKAEQFLTCNKGKGFGGIRIEDDVYCSATGADVLTKAIPKERAEIEALAGTA
ncbi:MAG: Xaa-Pro aminopeptidase [Myxococcaceae bacterium]